MATKYADFLLELEDEARAEGPEAVAELEALRARYRLARELMEMRRQQDLTQARLAELSGIGQAEICKIEGGGANPTVATVTALTIALGAELHVVPNRKSADVYAP